MRRVAIVGIGQTPVKEHWNAGLRDLAVDAIWKALADADTRNIQGLFVGNMLSGTLTKQEHLATLIADYAGFQGIEAVKVESACSSGASAVRQAVLAVASGHLDSALALGVEKLTETNTFTTTDGLASAADAEFETAMGISFVALNAMLMRRYMHEYGYQKEDFAPFIALAHQNAKHNPNAMFHFTVTPEMYRQAKMVADPINLLDSSPIADGAAAVLVVPEEAVSHYAGKPIWVRAIEVGTDTISLDNRNQLLWLSAAEISTRKALTTAGITHKDVAFFELHDAFSIMSALSLEGSGFVEAGQAVRLANEDYFSLKGSLPIATMGGLKARGHPVGATGVYQIVEAVQQLRGEAPAPLQLDNPRYGMCQNIGGSGATIVTTILSPEKP